MDAQCWDAVLSRITREDAADIDDLARAFDPRLGSGGYDIFPDTAAVLMPEIPMKRPDAVCIGLRVTAELADAADRAMRLAAFAVERDVEIVVLAHADTTGLERFGFRCELITGATEKERAACEDQVRRFWNIDLVL